MATSPWAPVLVLKYLASITKLLLMGGAETGQGTTLCDLQMIFIICCVYLRSNDRIHTAKMHFLRDIGCLNACVVLPAALLSAWALVHANAHLTTV